MSLSSRILGLNTGSQILKKLWKIPRCGGSCWATTLNSMTYHPQPRSNGVKVKIQHPHLPSNQSSWFDAGQVAITVPAGNVPGMLNAVPMTEWQEVPTSRDGWASLATPQVAEPAFDPPPGYKAAAGAVILEPDGRVWLVAPTNAFAGYQATFPKGTVTGGMDLQGTAIKEAFEESGLRIELLEYLVDSKRSESYTRYYIARRIGGSPTCMGWESQAAMLVPRGKLLTLLNRQVDHAVAAALGKCWARALARVVAAAAVGASTEIVKNASPDADRGN